jgi:hypothetical protein
MEHRVLGKIKVAKLVKKLSFFMTQRFIIFTRAYHETTLSADESSLHLVYPRSILKLSSIVLLNKVDKHEA